MFVLRSGGWRRIDKISLYRKTFWIERKQRIAILTGLGIGGAIANLIAVGEENGLFGIDFQYKKWFK